MKVTFAKTPSDLRLQRTAIAIGIFDGLHKGHQYLLGRMVADAKAHGLKTVVITFFPHPAHVLRPDIKLGYLTSLKDRLKLLAGMGIAHCIVIGFNRRFAHIDPQAFIRDMLVGQWGAKSIFVGADFKFGRDRKGDVALFKQMGRQYGFRMHAVAARCLGGAPISSTRIRQAVAAGDLKGAKHLLGRDFAVTGTVVKGAGRGRGLGFPTANVAYTNDVLPPLGVYAARVTCGNRVYGAAVNLGVRPSFKDKRPALHLEAHILGMHRNLYGQTIEVAFVKFIRPEKKFPNLQELIAQIRKDITTTRRLLS